MFALPAQFVWAAAAGYCAHESSPAAFHIGHHSHEHRSSPAEAADAAEMEAAANLVKQAHSDCSYCHAVTAQVASSQPADGGPAPRHVFASVLTILTGLGAEHSIERPKWTRAS